MLSGRQPAVADLLRLVGRGTRGRRDRRLSPRRSSGRGYGHASGAPGEILLEEFLTPLAVSQYQLAKAVDVPARRINEIVHGQRRITADTALPLSRYFGTSKRFWLNLQARYDLEIAEDRLGGALDDIRPLSAAS
jgi:antitoxin HigA-1